MFIHNNDTICAPATIPGTGAVSIVRISGPDSLKVAESIIRLKNSKLSSLEAYHMRFAELVEASGELIDQALVVVFRAPHSYTGEDSVEIYCHASSYIVSRILQVLCDVGARPAEPGEFSRRSFVNGKMDLAQAEAVADVIASSSAASHRIAMNQLKGGYSKELRSMRDELLNLSSLMELELDFSEEEVEFADRTRLKDSCDSLATHVSNLIQSFRLGNAIKNGIPTVIAGATNAGKSTLLNALLGEDRAIVSDIAGTTRDSIEASFNIGGNVFRIIDTAGLRKSDNTIEKIGIERSISLIEKADIVLAVFDASAPLPQLCESAKLIAEKAHGQVQLLVPVLNKIDLIDANSASNTLTSIPDTSVNTNVREHTISVLHIEYELLSILELPKGSFVEISAASGDGIDKLRGILSDFASRSLNQSATLVTNARHLEALKSALAALHRVRSGLDTMLPTDLIVQDLREALYHLGSITGEISSDEILGNIFSRFCIGK